MASDASDRKRRRIANARVRLHRAMERALAVNMRARLEQAARAAAAEARAKREHEEIAAAAMAVILSQSTSRILRAHIETVAREFIALTMTQIGITTDEIGEAAMGATRDWMPAYELRQRTEIAETTRRIIVEELREAEAAVAAQHTVDADVLAEDMAQRIEEALLGEPVRARAQTIAATITHAAAGESSDAAAAATSKQAQITIVKEWIALLDGKTRLTHLIALGQEVSIAESFFVGGVYLRFPGDPNGPAREIINCRCSVWYRRGALPAP